MAAFIDGLTTGIKVTLRLWQCGDDEFIVRDDVADWLNEPTRNGSWNPELNMDWLNRVDFYFTDPDTAFEFKMRWG